MVELKGHEESLGFDRPLGAKHGAAKHRPTWLEEREAEARELGYSKQPYVVPHSPDDTLISGRLSTIKV